MADKQLTFLWLILWLICRGDHLSQGMVSPSYPQVATMMLLAKSDIINTLSIFMLLPSKFLSGEGGFFPLHIKWIAF